MAKAPTNKQLSDGEQLDGLVRLSQALYQQYHDRRSLEWRVHLVLWTSIPAIGLIATQADVDLSRWAWLVFLFMPIHLIWIAKIVRGQVRDQELSEALNKKALKLLRFKRKKPKRKSLFLGLFSEFYWWEIALLSTTLLLSTFTYLMLTE